MLVAPGTYERAKLKAFVAEQVEQERISIAIRVLSCASDCGLNQTAAVIACVAAHNRISQRVPQLLIEVAKQVKMQVHRMTSASKAKVLPDVVIIGGHQIVSHRR